MAATTLLTAVGLLRPRDARPFCPACGRADVATDRRVAGGNELALPAWIAFGCLVLAGLAWAVVIEHSRSMTGMATMPGGLGSIGSFAGTWLVMMVAMMLPSATPVVLGFAEWAEGRHRWLAATGLLGSTYLSIWLAFGVACYFIYSALRMPWPNQAVIAGGAVVLAALYALTPIKRSNEQRCRQLCALHGPLPFNPLRSALVVGGKYGLSCIGCSAALMVAMVMIGMSNLIWMVALAAIVLLYKLAPAPGKSRLLLLSAVLAALGIAYPLLA